MNTLILFMGDKSVWSPELWAIQQGGKPGENDQVMLERANEWLSVLRYENIIHDYDDLELEALSTLLMQPTPFLIEWRGSCLVKGLLQSIPSDCEAVVDNDHGLIVSIADVRDLPFESWVRANKLRSE